MNKRLAKIIVEMRSMFAVTRDKEEKERRKYRRAVEAMRRNRTQ